MLNMAYDQLSRLQTQQSPLGIMSYSYDLAGRRTRVTWPDGFYAQYDYSVAGDALAIRENGAASGAGVLALYGYDDLGRRTLVTRGNGTSETASFDAAGRLEQLVQNLSGTGNDQSLSYTYNPAGAMVSRTGSDADFAWTPIVPETTNYTDNGLNQYSAIGGAAQAYDGRGNLASGSFGYDIHNNLTSGPSSASLAYDPGGRLYQTVGGGVTTRFLYDPGSGSGAGGARIVAEYNASNVLQRRFVPGPGLDEPVAWYEGAGVSDRRWLIADERGSVIAVTNSAGAASNINAYDEYGIPRAGNVGRFGFAGQAWLPEVSLTHSRARAYAPNAGRFVQTDPIGFAGGMNLYAYVGNDPVNFIDPFGLTGGCTPEDGPNCFTVTGTCPAGANCVSFADLVQLMREGGWELLRSNLAVPEGWVAVVDGGEETNPTECPQGPEMDMMRRLEFLGDTSISMGHYGIVLGGVSAATGALATGHWRGAVPGLLAMGASGQFIFWGSITSTVAGLGQMMLGDERRGAQALLDVGVGLALRNVPDELAPGADPLVDMLSEQLTAGLPTC